MSETITASLTVSGGDTITVNLNTAARGPAGTGGGGTTFVALTDASTADIPAINGPLASALAALSAQLSGKAPSSGISPLAISGTAVIATDPRLYDARTPTAHTHPASEISDATATGRALLTAATQSEARTTGLGSGATGDELFRALTPAAARETALNEILKYDPNAAATRTNPSAQAADDVLTGINLTAGIWEIHFYFSFNVLSGGVIPNLLFGTPGSVDLAFGFILGSYFVANQSMQVLSLNTTTGVFALQAGNSQTNRQYVGSLTVNITGNTSFGMTFARSTDVSGSTIIRRAGAFLRARKING